MSEPAVTRLVCMSETCHSTWRTRPSMASALPALRPPGYGREVLHVLWQVSLMVTSLVLPATHAHGDPVFGAGPVVIRFSGWEPGGPAAETYLFDHHLDRASVERIGRDREILAQVLARVLDFEADRPRDGERFMREVPPYRVEYAVEVALEQLADEAPDPGGGAIPLHLDWEREPRSAKGRQTLAQVRASRRAWGETVVMLSGRRERDVITAEVTRQLGAIYRARRRQLVLREHLVSELAPTPAITPSEIRAYYRRHREQLEREEQDFEGAELLLAGTREQVRTLDRIYRERFATEGQRARAEAEAHPDRPRAAVIGDFLTRLESSLREAVRSEGAHGEGVRFRRFTSAEAAPAGAAEFGRRASFDAQLIPFQESVDLSRDGRRVMKQVLFLRSRTPRDFRHIQRTIVRRLEEEWLEGQWYPVILPAVVEALFEDRHALWLAQGDRGVSGRAVAGVFRDGGGRVILERCLQIAAADR